MDAINRWNVTQEQKDKFIPIIKEFMKKVVENPDTKECIDFYNQGISPTQLKDILVDDFGFTDAEFDSSGWEFNFCISFLKDGREYVIEGTGMTFDMIFRLA